MLAIVTVHVHVHLRQHVVCRYMFSKDALNVAKVMNCNLWYSMLFFSNNILGSLFFSIFVKENEMYLLSVLTNTTETTRSYGKYTYNLPLKYCLCIVTFF